MTKGEYKVSYESQTYGDEFVCSLDRAREFSKEHGCGFYVLVQNYKGDVIYRKYPSERRAKEENNQLYNYDNDLRTTTGKRK